ncbi:hypothetical protein HYH02_003538 [Chlamydomonas schloesseri]|uniref:Uncharacterized protein n=1 Tax=Chlamydomonas schloesseri TaxID=2026947 RepID=A0A835WQV2_9CHLO|nr:hypothetical protein HYH02_003538 [Chlamydomonas schloesseri]|eukprot:KAG2451759.1 hypothetical protein HYH02_003538 [Chlamydomonas schloesseri]
MRPFTTPSPPSAAGSGLATLSARQNAQRLVPPARSRPTLALNSAAATGTSAVTACQPQKHGDDKTVLRRGPPASARPDVRAQATPESGALSRSSSAPHSRRHRSPSTSSRDASTAASAAAAQATIRLPDEQARESEAPSVSARRTPSALATAVAAARQATGPVAGTWEVGTRAVAADRKRRLRGPQWAQPGANGSGRQQQQQQQRQDGRDGQQAPVREQADGAAGPIPRGAAVGRHAFAAGAGRGLRGPDAWLAAAAAAASGTAAGGRAGGGNRAQGQTAATAAPLSPTAVRTAPARGGAAAPGNKPSTSSSSRAAGGKSAQPARPAVVNFVHSLTTPGALATAAAVRRAAAGFDTLEHWHASGGGALAVVAAAAAADAAAARTAGAAAAAPASTPAPGLAAASAPVWRMMKAELRTLVAAGSGRVSHLRRNNSAAGSGAADSGSAEAAAAAAAADAAAVEAAATRLLEAVAGAILDHGIYAVRNATTRLRQMLWRMAAETSQEAAEGAEDVEGAQAEVEALERQLVAAATELEQAGGGQVGPEADEQLSNLAEKIGAARLRAEAAWRAAEPDLAAAAAAAALRDAVEVPEWLRNGLSQAVGVDAPRLNGAQLVAVLAAAGAASLPFRPAEADALVRRALQLLAAGVRPQQNQQGQQHQQDAAAVHRGLPAADADGGSLSTDEAIAAALAAAVTTPSAGRPDGSGGSAAAEGSVAALSAAGEQPLPPALAALLMLLLVAVTPRELSRLQARWTMWAQFQRLTRGGAASGGAAMAAAAAGGGGGQLPLVAEAALLAAMDRMQLRAAGTPEEIAAMDRVSQAAAAGAAAARRQRLSGQAEAPQQPLEASAGQEAEVAPAALNGRQVATLLSCLSGAGNLIGSECLVRLTSALTAAGEAGELPPASAAAAMGALAAQYHGPSPAEIEALMAPLVAELHWAHDAHNPDRPRPTGAEAAAERLRLQQLPVLLGRVEAALGGGLRLPWAAPDDLTALREELGRFVASGGLRPLAAAEAWEEFLKAAAARPAGAVAPSPADLDAFIDAARADLLADASTWSEGGSVLERLMASGEAEPVAEAGVEAGAGGPPPAV